MKKKIIVVLVILILFVPIPFQLKDGGTIEWTSLTYKVSKVHKLNPNSKTGYEEGILIEILGMKVYDNVNIEISSTSQEDEARKITWEEITPNGVNEELLLKNVNEELLTQIATELQTLVEEEMKEERENPEIVI